MNKPNSSQQLKIFIDSEFKKEQANISELISVKKAYSRLFNYGSPQSLNIQSNVPFFNLSDDKMDQKNLLKSSLKVDKSLEWRVKMSHLSLEKDEVILELNRLTRKLEFMSLQLAEKDAHIKTLEQNKNIELKMEVQETQEEINEKYNQTQNQKNFLVQQNNELKKQLQELNNQNLKLNLAQQTLKQQQIQISQLEEKIFQFERKNLLLEDQLKREQNLSQQFKIELERDSDIKLQQKDKEILETIKQIQNLKKINFDFQSQLHKDQQNQRLKEQSNFNEIQQMKNENQELQSIIVDSQNQISRLNVRNQIDEYQQKYQNAKKTETDQRNELFKAQLALKKSEEEKNNNINFQTEQFKIFQENQEKNQARLQQLQIAQNQKIYDLQENIRQLEDFYNDKQEENDQLNKIIEQKDKNIEMLLKQQKDKTNEINGLNENNQYLQSQLSYYQLKCDELGETQSEYEIQIYNLNEEIDKFKSEDVSQKLLITELSKENKQLQEQIEQVKHKFYQDNFDIKDQSDREDEIKLQKKKNLIWSNPGLQTIFAEILKPIIQINGVNEKDILKI